jgi:hypothetical protein
MADFAVGKTPRRPACTLRQSVSDASRERQVSTPQRVVDRCVLPRETSAIPNASVGTSHRRKDRHPRHSFHRSHLLPPPAAPAPALSAHRVRKEDKCFRKSALCHEQLFTGTKRAFAKWHAAPYFPQSIKRRGVSDCDKSAMRIATLSELQAISCPLSSKALLSKIR